MPSAVFPFRAKNEPFGKSPAWANRRPAIAGVQQLARAGILRKLFYARTGKAAARRNGKLPTEADGQRGMSEKIAIFER